jgi:hypothetical protein
MQRALRARDRGCRFPGCDNRRFVDAHHVRHWAHGGETSLDNLILLCRRHHRAVHEGGYRVDGRGHPDDLVERNHELGIDADTCESGTGDPLDLDLAVDGMLAIERRTSSLGARAPA